MRHFFETLLQRVSNAHGDGCGARDIHVYIVSQVAEGAMPDVGFAKGRRCGGHRIRKTARVRKGPRGRRRICKVVRVLGRGVKRSMGCWEGVGGSEVTARKVRAFFVSQSLTMPCRLAYGGKQSFGIVWDDKDTAFRRSSARIVRFRNLTALPGGKLRRRAYKLRCFVARWRDIPKPFDTMRRIETPQ